MHETKCSPRVKSKAQAIKLSFISEASVRRLKRSLLTLCFIASIMLLIAIAAKNAENGGAVEAGAFDSGFTLYALCYDCSNADAVESLRIDFEHLRQHRIELVLPQEIRSISSNSALIFLKNAYSFDKLSEMLDQGLRAAIIIEEERVEKLSNIESSIEQNCSEAVFYISNSAKHASPILIGELFDLKLEIKSRFDIEIGGFILDGSSNTSELFSEEAKIYDIMLFEFGSGINWIGSGRNEFGVISIVDRDPSFLFSTFLEDGASN